jgi:hypothetical protein
MQAIKPGKDFSTSPVGVFSLFGILHTFYGIGIFSYQVFNLLNISADIALIKIKEKA